MSSFTKIKSNFKVKPAYIQWPFLFDNLTIPESTLKQQPKYDREKKKNRERDRQKCVKMIEH